VTAVLNSNQLNQAELLDLAAHAVLPPGPTPVELTLTATPDHFQRVATLAITPGPLRDGETYVAIQGRQSGSVPSPDGIVVTTGESDVHWLDRFTADQSNPTSAVTTADVSGWSAVINHYSLGYVELAWEPRPGVFFMVAGGNEATALAVARSMALDQTPPAK
jgi:hypothetical protein